MSFKILTLRSIFYFKILVGRVSGFILTELANWAMCCKRLRVKDFILFFPLEKNVLSRIFTILWITARWRITQSASAS
jgi:hypothetical protein